MPGRCSRPETYPRVVTVDEGHLTLAARDEQHSSSYEWLVDRLRRLDDVVVV
jgi:hypothetical protein